MSEQISQGMAQTRRAFIGQGALAFLAAAGMGHRASERARATSSRRPSRTSATRRWTPC